jgi:diguanylate cyclase (GGDEF)-like protein/PAS domain S-box-containing protein
MKLTAIPRITIGLVSLSVGLLLVFEMVLHLFPSEADTTREARARIANSLAIQAAALVQARDMRSVERTLAALQARDPDIVSIGLRRADGALVAQAGDHPVRWVAPTKPANASDALVVGIVAEQQRWGAIEIGFRPQHGRPFGEWLFSGPVKLMLLFSASGGLLFFLYLRRALQHLDPSAAIPDRVRGAFDALTEGVVIVDPNENILLANQSFQAMAPGSAAAELVGRRVSGLTWLTPALSEAGADAAPWLVAMRTRAPVHGRSFQVHHEAAAPTRVVINCSPLHDEQRGVRGCLITIDDVTALERSHERQLEVLADLATSKAQLELKNVELETLASRDPLSGTLNRRAFYKGMQGAIVHALETGTELACIMADIDHFKSINDRCGHAVGDEAIKRFGEVLHACAGEGNLVGRYGGEEFCVVVPGLGEAGALMLAETMRACLAADRSVHDAQGAPVSMSASFGVALLRTGARTEAELIDQADQAMYVAKKSGRNRVVAYKLHDQPQPEVAQGVLA